MNFDRLGLMPMAPLQLATAADVAMPLAIPLLITGEAQSDGALSSVLVSPEGEQSP